MVLQLPNWQPVLGIVHCGSVSCCPARARVDEVSISATSKTYTDGSSDGVAAVESRQRMTRRQEPHL